MSYPKNRRPGRPQGASSGFKSAPKSKPPVAKKPARKRAEKSPTANIEKTGYEVAYLDDLVRREQLVALVMQSGETLQGAIRYYDRDVFSLGPADGGPKLFLRKESIRYLYEVPDHEG